MCNKVGHISPGAIVAEIVMMRIAHNKVTEELLVENIQAAHGIDTLNALISIRFAKRCGVIKENKNKEFEIVDSPY